MIPDVARKSGSAKPEKEKTTKQEEYQAALKDFKIMWIGRLGSGMASCCDYELSVKYCCVFCICHRLIFTICIDKYVVLCNNEILYCIMHIVNFRSGGLSTVIVNC